MILGVFDHALSIDRRRIIIFAVLPSFLFAMKPSSSSSNGGWARRFWHRLFSGSPSAPMNASPLVLSVVHSDEKVVVVNKDANVLSVPGRHPSDPAPGKKRKRESEYWREAVAGHSCPVLAVGNVSCVPRDRDAFVAFAKRRGQEHSRAQSLWRELDEAAKAAVREDHGEEDSKCALGVAKSTFGDLRVVHRLDFETSGILCFARDKQSAADFCRAFRDRSPEKVYVALVQGRMTGSGTWDWDIEKDGSSPQPRYRAVEASEGRSGVESAKTAITDWKVIESGDEKTRLELRPRTGRSHQLRVHCKHAGHPIIGDPIYNPRKGDRLYLHAHKLHILEYAFEAPVPF